MRGATSASRARRHDAIAALTQREAFAGLSSMLAQRAGHRAHHDPRRPAHRASARPGQPARRLTQPCPNCASGVAHCFIPGDSSLLHAHPRRAIEIPHACVDLLRRAVAPEAGGDGARWRRVRGRLRCGTR